MFLFKCVNRWTWVQSW